MPQIIFNKKKRKDLPGARIWTRYRVVYLFFFFNCACDETMMAIFRSANNKYFAVTIVSIFFFRFCIQVVWTVAAIVVPAETKRTVLAVVTTALVDECRCRYRWQHVIDATCAANCSAPSSHWSVTKSSSICNRLTMPCVICVTKFFALLTV